MKKNYLFLSLFALIQLPAMAADELTDTVKVDEVVVTASKSIQSVGNVTQKIDIISKKEMEAIVSGNRNIAEVLMYKPGASVSALSRNDANWGTYGGIGPKYSTYMLQGLPIDAFVDPMALELNAVDRIEIQRGPASVLYPNYLSQDFAGNQSPLAGTVNLILKDKIEVPSTMVATSYGSYNTLNTQAYHENKAGRATFFAGVTYEKSDYTNYGTENSWLNIQDDPEYTKSKLYGGINYFIDELQKQKISLFVNHTKHNGDAGRLYRGFDHQYDLVNLGYSILLTNKISFQSNIGLRAYQRIGQESRFNVMDTLLSTNGNNQSILPFDMSVSIKHGESGNLIVGTDYQSASYYNWSDPLTGYKTYGTKASAFQNSVYVHEEYTLSGLTLRGGLRYTYIQNKIDLINGSLPGQKEKSWNAIIWSAGAKYKISNQLHVFTNAGNSFMSPGLKAVGGTISESQIADPNINGQLANPDLKPESGMAFDGGLNFITETGIKAGIRGFYINVTDAIIDKRVSETPSRSQSVNAGEASSTGAELEINYQYNNYISVFANATKFNTKLKNELNPDQDGANVPFSPEMVANIGVQLKTTFGTQIGPFVNYNGGFYDSDSKSGRKKFEPGALICLNILQEIKKDDNFKVDIFTNIYNLSNNRYEMPWQFRNTGFSFMAGVKATF